MSHSSQRRAFARFLARITLAAVVALPVLTAAIWVFWDQLAPHAAGGPAQFYDATALGIGARFAGFTLFLAGALIQAYGLLGVRRTFLEAAHGRALSNSSVSGFQRFAWVSLIMVIYGVFQRTALIALLSMSDPRHEGALSIQIGSPELKAIFMGLLLVFVAHVFAEGKDAKDENEAFL